MHFEFSSFGSWRVCSVGAAGHVALWFLGCLVGLIPKLYMPITLPSHMVTGRNEMGIIARTKILN